MIIHNGKRVHAFRSSLRTRRVPRIIAWHSWICYWAITFDGLTGYVTKNPTGDWVKRIRFSNLRQSGFAGWDPDKNRFVVTSSGKKRLPLYKG